MKPALSNDDFNDSQVICNNICLCSVVKNIIHEKTYWFTVYWFPAEGTVCILNISKPIVHFCFQGRSSGQRNMWQGMLC
jgi:hypothetical protein